MDTFKIKFVGAPKRTQDQFTFYKAFKFRKNGHTQMLAIGEFLFLDLDTIDDPCIAEVQLIWTDSSDTAYCTLRLYFLPEQTPLGRLPSHGEHEVLAASEKLSMALGELVLRLTSYTCPQGLVSPAPSPLGLAALRDNVLVQGFLDRNSGLDLADIRRERAALPSPSPEGVLVLSYPRYCRYRSILKRVAGAGSQWLTSALILGLGGVLPLGGTRVLFCRDSFLHEGLPLLPFNVDHIAPSLRPKHKKQSRSRGGGATSSGEEEASSPEPCTEVGVSEDRAATSGRGVLQDQPLDEQEFLQNLFKFMKLRNTPISRVPYLGFKKIDLYLFYTAAQRLGGYDKITCKRLWKRLYDEMGGDPGSTSAATCTRRHYEKLLLPFERYIRRQAGECSPPSPTISIPEKDETTPLRPPPLIKTSTVVPHWTPKPVEDKHWNDIRKKNAISRTWSAPRPKKSESQLSTLLSQLASNPEITLLPATPPPPPLLKIPTYPPPSSQQPPEVLDLSLKRRSTSDICLDLTKKKPSPSKPDFPLYGKYAPPPNLRYHPFPPYHTLYKPVGAP